MVACMSGGLKMSSTVVSGPQIFCGFIIAWVGLHCRSCFYSDVPHEVLIFFYWHVHVCAIMTRAMPFTVMRHRIQ
jgi:hypothetical protein